MNISTTSSRVHISGVSEIRLLPIKALPEGHGFNFVRRLVVVDVYGSRIELILQAQDARVLETAGFVEVGDAG